MLDAVMGGWGGGRQAGRERYRAGFLEGGDGNLSWLLKKGGHKVLRLQSHSSHIKPHPTSFFFLIVSHCVALAALELTRDPPASAIVLRLKACAMVPGHKHLITEGGGKEKHVCPYLCAGVCFLHLLCGFQRATSGHQAWQKEKKKYLMP